MARDLVFEIGVEEIPSGALYGAVTQLKELAAKALKDARLDYADVRVYGSPRRLILLVLELAERQEDLSMRSKGPSVKAAYDTEGNPTPAAVGFARGKGVELDDLVREEEAGGEYVYALIERAGQPADTVLPALLTGLVEGLDWPKSQRWGSGTARFIRPVRWLLALFGSEVVPVGFAGLTAGRTTWGHRFLEPEPIEVPAAADFFLALERGKVMPDAEGRALFIREGLAAAAESEGATAVVPEKVFAEVVNLVEYPTVAVGHFDEAFLRVPREVLETAMESHQRYFPLESADGALTCGFLVVHNGDPKRTEAIVHGHERVIRARLADAAFFYDEDLKASMETWVERLGSIVFQEQLGTLESKVDRIEALVRVLADASDAPADVSAHAVRAAHLCKADLVSHAVVEFPSLQGVMGRYYALASGEHAEVADAIAEHYRPRFAGDELPETDAGILVAASDRFDTICGIFAIGEAPTGSSDPYALRRAAIGLLTMALEGRLRFTLGPTIGAALGSYAHVLTTLDEVAAAAEVRAFIVGRLEGVLRDRGHAYDTVDAVLAVASDDPYDAGIRAVALTEARGSEAIADLSVAFARAKNLAQPDLGVDADRALMAPTETALTDAMDGAYRDFAAAMATGDYQEALGVLAQLRGPIDTFFDEVLVMDPDPAVRDNRLRLLNRFVALFGSFADFSRLAG